MCETFAVERYETFFIVLWSIFSFTKHIIEVISSINNIVIVPDEKFPYNTLPEDQFKQLIYLIHHK